MRFTLESRTANSFLSVSKVQSSPRCPNPAALNMSKGIESGLLSGSSLNTKRAFGSMKRRINHADETRSIPGRGRVIQIRLR